MIPAMTTATDFEAWRPDSLPNRLRLFRGQLGVSQREAAMRIGITPRIWQNMEDGRAVRSLHKHIAAIADAYGVDRDWLMWGGPLNEETPAGPNGPDGGSDECPQQGSNLRPADYQSVIVPLWSPSVVEAA